MESDGERHGNGGREWSVTVIIGKIDYPRQARAAGRASRSVSRGPSPGSARPSRRSRVAVRARLRLLGFQVGRGLKRQSP